jgi:hypothetical protein
VHPVWFLLTEEACPEGFRTTVQSLAKKCITKKDKEVPEMSNKRMEISNPEHTAAGGPKRHNASRWNRVRIGFWISWIVASLISITLGLQGLGILAFWRTSGKGHLATSPEWDLTNSVCFAFVLYTILSVITTHKIDEPGFRS